MPKDAPTPETLGRYQILRRLGAGGMAEVFLAKSTGAEGIEKILVVKRVLPTFARSEKFIAMFLEEAKIATRLNHPNIVQVYAFEQVKDEFLLAMEFVDGLDLGRLVAAARRRGSRIPYAIAAYATMEVARGLDYAHKRKDERGEPMEIVHRDVSPQNVLLSYEGVVKAADFGIAKARMVSEETGVIKGKFSYMSPEQARGERVDRRSDVYSIGVLLAELLMNRPMYPGQHGLDVLEQVRSGKVTLPGKVDPAVPKGLDAIVEKALSYERDERQKTARGLASELGHWLHGQDQVVDGHTLETFISEMVPREVTSPDARGLPARPDLTAATIASAVANAERELRERRHVVVVAGRVRGRQGTEPGDAPAAMGDEAARVLGDIAYKTDAVLTWPDGAGRERFRFILGLRRASVHDPLASMTLGLDVVDALDGLSEDLDSPVSASLGVSRGVVSTVRDQGGRLIRYEPIGSVLSVAERLADEGPAGEILVAGEVFRLVRRAFSFEDAGSVEVDTDGSGSGAATLRAHRLKGARTREERVADARSIGAGAGLVGREEELEAFAEAYGEAVNERRSVFLALTGDLGVGKTALVSAAVDSLDPKPRVLHAECAFGASDVPFATGAEVVRVALGIEDDLGRDEVGEALDRWAAEAIGEGERRDRLVKGLRFLLLPEVEGGADAAERPGHIRRACRILIGTLAARQPLLIWIDALQWADSPSLDLFGSLATSPDAAQVPLLAVFSSRPDPRTGGILSGLPHIEVGELGDAERRRLITGRFDGAQVPSEVSQSIVERAGGNPFFIIELVEALVDRGVVRIDGEGVDRRVVRKPGVPIALPTTLEGVIAARLDELPEAERRAIRWLAAAGAGIGRDALSEMAGSDLGEALTALESRGFVARHGDTYNFPSAVVRHVAYETTDESDRETMHKQIGAWLSAQRVPAPPARVARHLERAGDLAAAADAYLQAAARARAVYSNKEALRFFARALALLPPDAPGRFYAHEAREQILRGMGSHRDQQVELEHLRGCAKRNGDPAMVAMAMNRSARFELDHSRTLGVQDYLEHALECAAEANDKGGEVEALRLSAQLARENGDARMALDFCDRALARCGLDRALLAARGSVLVQKAEVLRRMGRVHQAVETVAEAIIIFRRLGIRRNESMALNGLGIALAGLGEFEDASVVIRASIGVDREIGDRMHLGRKLSNVGQLNAELGEVEIALEFLERADEVMNVIFDDAGRADALSATAELVLETLEDPDLAAEKLDHARRIAERTEDRYDQARERIVRASLEVVMGRLEQAEEAARQAVEIAEGAGIIVYQLLAQARLAEILANRGKAEEARAAIESVRAVVGARGQIERGERVHLALARAFESLSAGDEARLAYAEAYQVVELRLSQIRSPEVRERYLDTPVVKAIRSAL